MWLFNKTALLAVKSAEFGTRQLTDTWVLHLLLNCLSYVTIIIPVCIIIHFIKKTSILSNSRSSVGINILKLLVNGHYIDLTPEISHDNRYTPKEKSFTQRSLTLVFCASGLLISYVMWGIYQERLMAQEYDAQPNKPGERFQDSEFLVFANRISAFLLAISILIFSHRLFNEPSPPIHDYAYASLSNIFSSWFQYEVLKYVIFPVLVLAKSCKIIPVMIMGKFINRQTYSWQEYATATAISFGVAIFFYYSQDTILDQSNKTTAGLLSGIILVSGYLLCDSFTSNWQGHLFRQHHVSSLHMMAGINLCSVVFTVFSLGEQGGFREALAFAQRHPLFVYHVAWQALTSAIGQLFIFKTIGEFGPVVFTIITTFRQALSILISCILYNHPVSVAGMCGLLIAFVAIFAQIVLNQSKQKERKKELKLKPAEELQKV